MPYVEAKDGTKLFYKDWGRGPPVIFIHGWPLNADMWDYQMVPLSRSGLRCIAYDRRGFGRSDQPWTGYDYDTLSDDLASLIEQLQLSDVSLVGFSMGGGEVARYMSRHKAKAIRAAVLVSAVTPYMLATSGHLEGVDAKIFANMREEMADDRPYFLAGFGKQFFGAGLLNFSISDELLQWAQNLALQASVSASLDCIDAFSSTDFRPDMGSFSVPTLIIHGDADATVPIDVAGRRSAKMIAGSQFIEYSGAPHGLFYTHRRKLNEDLAQFLGATVERSSFQPTAHRRYA